jgi:hypothetical protein
MTRTLSSISLSPPHFVNARQKHCRMTFIIKSKLLLLFALYLPMGKGNSWTAEEREHLAEAWIHASESIGEAKVKGTNQDSDEFWSSVYSEFTKKGPTNPKGVYGDRPQTAVRNYFRDKIARDVKSFNKSILKVLSSRPTGVDEQQKINMAVAIHKGKTDAMNYRHKDFEAHDWSNYKAWLVLRTHPAYFQPSPPPDDIEAIEDSDAEENTSDSNKSNSGSDFDSDKTGRALFKTPDAASVFAVSREKSRGPGAGVKKTKAKAFDDEYRKKKTKIQEELLHLQKQRQDDFSMYVKNNAKAEAFKMAVMGYNAMKDSDPVEAAKYKDHMNRILQFSDGENEMPSLETYNNTAV